MAADQIQALAIQLQQNEFESALALLQNRPTSTEQAHKVRRTLQGALEDVQQVSALIAT